MASEKKDGNGNVNFLKEWETSRGVLDRFDGYLDVLRKYSFGLITTLLAAEAFLLPYSENVDGSGGVTSANWPDNIKTTKTMYFFLCAHTSK
ncbi:MAG: hypothetical protein JSV85_04570 [Candidatus Bathyarchaeota archaeon]|nr:MAG: hypothetical protein JSV85_04570 [Candidatus Bathyarchaeota archaeon]